MTSFKIKARSGVKIIFSFFLSVIFIWIVGIFFCNSLIYYQYDDTLKKMIHSPKTVYKHRTEGIAETYIGLYGINGIEDITKDNRNKIVIWGDSYVQAHEVNDPDKIPQVITKRLSEKGFGEKLMCFGVGMGLDSVADYYFDIPKYERLTQSVVSHFIIVTTINDTLPDKSTDEIRGIFKSNPLRLYQDNWKPEFQKIKKALNKIKLSFIWQPVRSTLSSLKTLRFAPTKRNNNFTNFKEFDKEVYSQKFLSDSWTFLFKKLREQTEIPITIVYCPAIPIIQNGKVIVEDNNGDYILLFKKIAKKYNISVLNVTDTFLSFYKRSELFPRGFSNSKPSSGHFNKYGHEIVSEVIMTHILNEVE